MAVGIRTCRQVDPVRANGPYPHSPGERDAVSLREDAARAGRMMTEEEIGDGEGPVGGAAAGRVSD